MRSQVPYIGQSVKLFEVESVAGAAVITGIPEGTKHIELSSGGITVTATGASVTAAAGDDVTIEFSVDGVNFFSPSLAGTAVTLGLDDGGVYIAPQVYAKFLRLTTAQILATETVKFNVACIA